MFITKQMYPVFLAAMWKYVINQPCMNYNKVLIY